ncbi:MAG: TolC family protein [Deltaproteobacteria bacterium]|nr:TolC family protein [Deltaproteobacteria bacterium]
MSPVTVFAALVLAQTAAPATAPAPAAPTAPAKPAKVLTLREAIDSARTQNLDIQQLDARIQMARQLTWKAWSFYLPQVNARLQTVRNEFEVSFEIPTGPGTSVTSVVTPTVQTQGQVKLTQALVAPQAWFLISNAYKAEKVIDYNIQQARRDILFAIAQLYYGVANLKELIVVQERQVVLTKERERDSRVRFEAGTGAKVGLLRAEIDRAQAEEDLKRAQIDFQRAKLSLATALVRPNDFDIVLPSAPTPPKGSNLEQQALELRPDVKAAAENLDLAYGQRTQLYMQYLPTIGGFGAYNYVSTSTFTPNNFSWQVGIGLTWTLLDGGLREASIREATARVAEADAAKRLTDLRAVERVKQSQLDLESAVANRSKAKERTGLAQENARLVDVAYKAGAATYLEATDSIQTLRQAEVGLVFESLNVDLATLKLLNAVGAFEEVNN